LRKRAADVDGTRQRIVEATVALHGTVGPAETTIAAIAERAGVTRQTVYRHFPDEDALFATCSSHWLSRQTPTNPALWAQIDDPIERTRAGLTDLYRFYRAGEAMLTKVYRDKLRLPASRQAELENQDRQLLNLFLAGYSPAASRLDHLKPVIGHAISFWTWRSLCLDFGLTNADAVELMVGLVGVVLASQGKQAQRRDGRRRALR
jgi:AcrR family transcriptional regulator